MICLHVEHVHSLKSFFFFDSQVKGYLEDGLDEALQGCDIVVVPAGVPRKPGNSPDQSLCALFRVIGMTRDDLFNTNASIVQKLSEAAAK